MCMLWEIPEMQWHSVMLQYPDRTAWALQGRKLSCLGTATCICWSLGKWHVWTLLAHVGLYRLINPSVPSFGCLYRDIRQMFMCHRTVVWGNPTQGSSSSFKRRRAVLGVVDSFALPTYIPHYQVVGTCVYTPFAHSIAGEDTMWWRWGNTSKSSHFRPTSATLTTSTCMFTTHTEWNS